jgi:hypothetical protein
VNLFVWGSNIASAGFCFAQANHHLFRVQFVFAENDTRRASDDQLKVEQI